VVEEIPPPPYTDSLTSMLTTMQRARHSMDEALSDPEILEEPTAAGRDRQAEARRGVIPTLDYSATAYS